MNTVHWYCPSPPQLFRKDKQSRGRNSKASLSCCCSVAQSCLTLCDTMDCSTLGFPVFHYLPEFAQTHVHWVYDAIQTSSHPLSLPLLLPSVFPSIRIFSSCGQRIGASNLASVLPLNIQGLFPLGLTGLISLLSKGFSRVFSSTKCFESLYAFKNYTEQMLNKSALNHPWFQQEITREIKNILNWLKVKTQQIKIYGTKLNQCLEKNLWL